MKPSDMFEIAAQKYEKGLVDDAQRYAEAGLRYIWSSEKDKDTKF